MTKARVCSPVRRFSWAIAVILAVFSAATFVRAQIPGRNVNMVSGAAWPEGDPHLQRQNEPSLAASTRNPLRLLGGANDYRTVDLPGLPTGGETGDAWLGLYKSMDGGQRWTSSLLPGYPQDQTTSGKASPIYGYQAAADPVVRAGASGLFLYSGLVFDRTPNGRSRVFASRFIDNNNKEAGDPVHYLGTSVVASDAGTTGAFLDKPWIAVDIPRISLFTCRIETPGPGATKIVQRIPAGRAYIAYTVIRGTGTDMTATIMFSRSIDCGVTWSTPTAISRTTDKLNQGATIAIEPSTGVVHVAWRKFGVGTDPDAIMVTRSIGGIIFESPRSLRQFRTGRDLFELLRFLLGRRYTPPVAPPAPVDEHIQPFDQGTLADRFRTNAYPTMAIDGSGRAYVAWSERGFRGPGSDDASVVMSTSTNGGAWTPAFAVETHGNPGHQFMPSLAFAGGKLMLVYYDMREDLSGVFRTFVDDASALFFSTPKRRHTLDLRATQADPAAVPVFAPSVRVSEYAVGSRPGSQLVEQLQFNPPNLPLFQLGGVPFIGDYVDIAAAPSMLQDASGKWKFNTAPVSSPVFHTAWTDNRDVRPPSDGNWTAYTPAVLGQGQSKFDPTQNVPLCEPGRAGMRNQNVYTSRITGGLLAGSPGNTKPLSGTLPRGFVVFAQNGTTLTKMFRFKITNQPPGGRASFTQLATEALLTQMDAIVPPRSTVSRTVFATSSNPDARINVDVSEIAAIGAPAPDPAGLRASIVLNPDIANPDIANPDIANPDIANPDIANAEVYNPDIANPDIANPDIANPDIANPDIANPDIANPDIANIVVMNPDIANPDIANPDIANPDIANPDIANPDIANPDIANGSLTDVTWTVTNRGNTTASYDINLISSSAIPAGIKTQLIVHKTYHTPVSDGCTLKLQQQNVLVTSIPNPDIANPDIANATLWLEPGGRGMITLRIVDPDPQDNITFNPLADESGLTPQVQADAVNTQQLNDPNPEPPVSTPPTTSSTALSFGTQPAGALVSQPLGPFQIQALTTAGATTNPAAGLAVTVGIVTNPGGGQLLGTTTVLTDAAGTAVFSGLSIDRAGTGYRFVVTAGAADAVPVSSAFFDISLPGVVPGTQLLQVTTTADSGPGSLRAAILAANALPNTGGQPDLIAFSIRTPGPHMIAVTTPLPEITEAAVIDATTQPGFAGVPVVELRWAGTPRTADVTGFDITAGGSTIRGFTINRFGAPEASSGGRAIWLHGAGGNTILGNYIGTDANGGIVTPADPPGNHSGIVIDSGGNVIGDAAPGARNIVSGNLDGVLIRGGAANIVGGNFIGVDPTGLAPVANASNGISVFNLAVTNTLITGNLVSGNDGWGISIEDSGGSDQILGNVVGLDAAGNLLRLGPDDYVDGLSVNFGPKLRGNRSGGVRVVNAPGTFVGMPGGGNVISGNTNHGLVIAGSTAPIVQVRGNLIGTDPTGMLGRGNVDDGIQVSADGTIIGGLAAGDSNVVSGNLSDGVIINAISVRLEANFVGTDITGMAALGNGRLQSVDDPGCCHSGIQVGAAGSGAVIGGSDPLARNIVSGNHTGLWIGTAPGLRVEGNLIGGNALSTGYLPNDGDGGIALYGTPGAIVTGNNISGNTSLAGIFTAGATLSQIENNVLTANSNSAIVLTGAGSGNRIWSNSIYANGGLGIDLGWDGVTANDPLDADTGPNDLINVPTLTSATQSSVSVRIAAAPLTTYRIDLYASAVGDPSGFGEGQRHLGNLNIVTDNFGTTAPTPFGYAGAVVLGEVITATATLADSTSEFSPGVTVTTPPFPPPPSGPTTNVGPVGGGGGAPFGPISCPAGALMTALRGRTGDDIDRTEIWCSAVGPFALGPATFAGSVGGFGGVDYGNALTCPADSAVTGLHGRAGIVIWGGNVVDTIGVTCRNLVTGAIFTSPTRGNASPGAPPFAIDCPAGQVGVAIFGGQGGLLDRIGLVCQGQ